MNKDGLNPPINVRDTGKNIFTKDVITLTSGTIFAQIITILCSPIITRLYGPEAFGNLALFISIINTVGVIICLRYEISILLPKTDDQAANLLCLCLIIVSLLSLLSIPILFFEGDYLVYFLHSNGLKSYLWLIPPTLLVFGIYQAMMYWNTRTKHFGRLSLARGANAVAVSGTQIGSGLIGHINAGGLIFAYVFGQIISCIVPSSQIMRDHYIFLKNSITKEKIILGFKRYAKFPIYDSWSALLTTISNNLPVFLLSSLFTSQIVGFYSLGFVVLQMPMSFIGGSISQVFFQRASVLKHESEQKLSKLVERTTLRLIVIGILPLIIITLAGKDIFTVIFGLRWAEAGVYAQILAIYIFISFLSSPISSLFSIFEQQRLTLILNVVVLIFRTLALIAGALLGSVIIALILFSIVSLFFYGGSLIWLLYISKVSLYDLVVKFKPYSLICISIGFIIILLDWICHLNPVLIVITSAIISLFYYYFVIKNDDEIYTTVLGPLINRLKNR